MPWDGSDKPLNLRSLAVVGLWFGIVSGLVEGIGLLSFQKINWAAWGPTIHVAEEILWISPLVDVVLFLLVAVLVFAIARLLPRVAGDIVVVYCLAFLAVYDWLTLTGRLYHRACFLLALGVAAVFVRWYAKHRDAALRFWRRTIWLVLAALVFIFAGIEGGKWVHERYALARLPAASGGSPNVLVIVVDTLRADHVSAYGYPRPTTPNLDSLARQGVLFENAIAPCSWSLPSHVSLLTGRYEFEHGVGNIQPVPWFGWGSHGLGGYPTLAEALQNRGYRTGAFSANRTYFSRSLGFGRGFIHFEDYFHSTADSFLRTLYGREFARIYLNRTEKSKVKRAIRFLGMDSLLDKDSEGSGAYGGAQAVRKRASAVNDEVLSWLARDSQHPFFVFINYFDPHFPYGPPRAYPRPDWDKGTAIDEYDASVRYVDDYMGRLLQELQTRGLLQNTLIVLTSDHGESLGDHGLAYHAQALYRELIHVPLVISYPGQVPAGFRVGTPVTNAAIASTVLEVVSRKETTEFPGPPLTDFWEGTCQLSYWPAPISELAKTDIMGKEDKEAGKIIPTAFDGAMKSLVTSQWHLITHEKRGDQLYHWETDPREVSDLVKTDMGQAAVTPLKSHLNEVTATPVQRKK